MSDADGGEVQYENTGEEQTDEQQQSEDTNQDDEHNQEEDIPTVEIDDTQTIVNPHISTIDPESIRGLLRPAAAEMLGCAIFVFVSCGSAMTMGPFIVTNTSNGVQSPGAQNLGIALTFGLTIATLCFAIGHLSGGHLNFAVTFAFAMLRKISIYRAGLYFMGQFTGGLIGIAFLKLVTPTQWLNINGVSNCFAANFVHPELTVGHALVAEILMTFVLMFTIMAACDPTKSNTTLVPVAIGLAVFILHMLGIPITGCSLNPTRSFASAVAASGVPACGYVWNYHWVFWLAPLLGSVLAAFVYELLFNAGGGLVNQYLNKKDDDIPTR